MSNKVAKLTLDPTGRNIKLGGKTMVRGLSFSATTTSRLLREDGTDTIIRTPERLRGSDLAGDFRGIKRAFYREYVDSRGRHWEMDQVSVEIRLYADVFAIRTACMSEDSLVSENHFRLEICELVRARGVLAIHNYCDWWTRPLFSLDDLPRSQMVLWQTNEGTYGCLIALVDGGCRAQLTAKDGKLGVDQVLYDGGHCECEAFAVVGGFGDNPYELVRRCVERGMDITGRPGKLRWEKPYPDLFSKIGWCTWDAFYADVTERGILKKMQEAKNAGFPFRWVLIDDGWSPLEERQLAGFDADQTKFPRGLKPLVDELKKSYKVEQVGVWHTFTGYWRGISEKSDVYKLNREHILEGKRGTRIPYPNAARGFGFWNAWHSHLREQGIGFVKVDNQGATYHHTQGTMPVSDAGRGQQYALQSSVGLNFNNQVINCMCMLPENAWHWVSSNVSRNSDDFWPKKIESGPEHARQNIYANLLYNNFAWPDWDMWWSCHPLAKYHAAMRAISGGPVYVSDRVGESDFEVLWPLILADGTLLRCDAPALPTRDSLFVDPKNNPVLIKAFNTVGKAGMLLAINATDGEKAVRGHIKPSDIEGIYGDKFAIREYFTGAARLLDISGVWEMELGPYEARLFSVVPIVDGIAVIGLANKYVSPATVTRSARTAGGLYITLAEGGKLVFYSEKK